MNRVALRLLPICLMAASAVLALSFPELASAQIASQCRGIDCELCHLFELANRLIQYAIYLGSVIAAGLFAYAGAKMVIAAGDPAKITSAKNIFRSVITGYIIALCAFLFVDTLINSIAQRRFTWKNVDCQTTKRKLEGGLTFQLPENSVFIVGQGTGSADPEGLITTLPPREARCNDCVVASSEIPGFNRAQSCAQSVNGACRVSEQISNQLVSFSRDAKAAGISWEATELWPPTSSAHQAGCHYNGTCIDAALRGTSASAQNIAQFISIANQNGFRAEYEVATEREAQVIRMQAAQNGVTLGPRDVFVVPYINGPHFSMYKK